MMKKFAVVFALLFFGLSVAIFFTKPQDSLRQKIEEQEGNKERIILRDFLVETFVLGKRRFYASSGSGILEDPNKLKMVEGVKIFDIIEDLRLVQCEKAELSFSSHSIAEILNQAEPKSGFFEGDVMVTVGELLLKSEKIYYDKELGLVWSDLPVEISSPEGVSHAEKGFKFLSGEKILVLKGNINGKFWGSVKIAPAR